MSEETFDSYNVTFVFDFATVTTTVFAMSAEVAPDLACDQIMQDLGISSRTMDLANDITVELLDKDVL